MFLPFFRAAIKLWATFSPLKFSRTKEQPVAAIFLQFLLIFDAANVLLLIAGLLLCRRMRYSEYLELDPDRGIRVNLYRCRRFHMPCLQHIQFPGIPRISSPTTCILYSLNFSTISNEKYFFCRPLKPGYRPFIKKLQLHCPLGYDFNRVVFVVITAITISSILKEFRIIFYSFANGLVARISIDIYKFTMSLVSNRSHRECFILALGKRFDWFKAGLWDERDYCPGQVNRIIFFKKDRMISKD